MTKQILMFVLHVLLAMVASMIVGGLLSSIAQSIVAPVSESHWVSFRITTDVPYSPFFWGSALIIGFISARRIPSRSAHWVWLMGLGWFSLFVWDAVHSHRADSCQGCNVIQSIWRNLFAVGYHSCQQECLGELFGTAPLMTSVGYSLGAWLGLRDRNIAPQETSV
jgi:hypothetical protein